MAKSLADWQLDAVLKAARLAALIRKLTEVIKPPCPPVFGIGDNGLDEAGAVADVLGVDAAKLNADRFYRNMDAIHGHRVEIETALYGREKSLFNRQGQSMLY